MKSKPAAQEELDAVLETPPEGWVDPDGDGRKAPERDKLAWAVWLMGGSAEQAHAAAMAIVAELPRLKRKLEIHKARIEETAAQSVASDIASRETELKRLEALVESAGPWVRHNVAALRRDVSTAQRAVEGVHKAMMNLSEARTLLRPETLARERGFLNAEKRTAEDALQKADERYRELRATADSTREKLGALRARAAARKLAVA